MGCLFNMIDNASGEYLGSARYPNQLKSRFDHSEAESVTIRMIGDDRFQFVADRNTPLSEWNKFSAQFLDW